MTNVPDIIFYNGKITTLDEKRAEVTALAVADGNVIGIGQDNEIRSLGGPSSKVINLIGGLSLYGDANCLDRTEALRVWPLGIAYKSNEEIVKGALKPGAYAYLAVLSADIFRIADAEIKDLVPVTTVVGGKIVYAADELSSYDAPLPPASPDWSPVQQYGVYPTTRHEHVSARAGTAQFTRTFIRMGMMANSQNG
jgi:predicted amidohydrolase YtcJ